MLLAVTATYGQVQLRRDTTQVGPRIAVLQGDYLSTVYGNDTDDREKMQTYLAMIDEASKHEPDLYLLPPPMVVVRIFLPGAEMSTKGPWEENAATSSY